MKKETLIKAMQKCKIHERLFDSLWNVFKDLETNRICTVSTIINEHLGFIRGQSINSIDYWIRRGWTKEEAEDKKLYISKKGKSVYCVEYWLNKGFSHEESVYKVKSRRPLNKEYWLNKGYDDEEALKAVKDFQTEMSNRSNNKHKHRKDRLP